MFKFLFFILFLTFINSNTYAADDLNEGNWVGLYLPKEMIDDKEFPDFSWYSQYESYVLIISYKEKLIFKAKTFAGLPRNRRVSEFEGEIKNYNLSKNILRDKNCTLSIELLREPNKSKKLILKDSGFWECGDVRLDGEYFEYTNPAWKNDEELLKGN